MGDQNFENVVSAIEKVVLFRKELATGIYKIHEDLTNYQLKCLKTVKVKLRKPDTNPEISDDILKNFTTETKEDYDHEQKMYDQLKLLDIINSKSSPMQRVIDEI